MSATQVTLSSMLATLTSTPSHPISNTSYLSSTPATRSSTARLLERIFEISPSDQLLHIFFLRSLEYRELHHYLDNDVIISAVGNTSVNLESAKIAFDALEDVDECVLACAYILSCLKDNGIRIAGAKQLTRIRTAAGYRHQTDPKLQRRHTGH
ncbi:hypothetical protein BC826DRAFT_1001999 [Russula brevipes]|nr:hypothetical protein BC826DRAFT_1001999 [Russula brevipes]